MNYWHDLPEILSSPQGETKSSGSGAASFLLVRRRLDIAQRSD